MDVSAPRHVMRQEGGWGTGGRCSGLGLMSGEQSSEHRTLQTHCDSSPAQEPQAPGTAQTSTEAIDVLEIGCQHYRENRWSLTLMAREVGGGMSLEEADTYLFIGEGTQFGGTRGESAFLHPKCSLSSPGLGGEK